MCKFSYSESFLWFFIKNHEKYVKKKYVFLKKSLNCNKNELCTKIQHDPNIFGENNGFF